MPHEIKILVFGSGGVGKTAVTIQFVQEVFLEKIDCIVEDFRKKVVYEGEQYILEIVDTSGTEQFTAMRELLIKKSHGFVIVYSITDSSSFDKIHELRELIRNVKETDDVPIVIVGNKCDLFDDRVITTAQGQDFAQQFGADFFETSAKTNVNVQESFFTLLQKILSQEPVLMTKKKRHGKRTQDCLVM